MVPPRRPDHILQPGIATVDVVHPGDHRLSLRPQGGHCQGAAAPQVGGLHPGSVEPAHPPHQGHPALHRDVRPHAGQLGDMPVTAVKHIFYEHGRSLPGGQSRHDRGLSVGGKAGIGGGTDGGHSPQRPGRVPVEGDSLPIAVNPAARLHEYGAHRGHMPPVHPFQADASSGSRSGSQQGSRYDTVPHNGIVPSGQGPHPLHRNH